MGVFQWGAQSSALYATGYEDGTRDLKRYNADSGRLTSINDDLKTTYSKRKIDAGSLGHLRLGLTDDHTIEAISLLTRKTTDTAQLKEGTTGSGDDTIRSTSIEWNERELFFNQFIGSHEFFGRLLFDWRYSQADARNYIPDSRFYRYELRGEEYLLSNRSDGNSRTFSNMVDLAEDWGVDVSLSLADWKPVVLRTKGGVASFYKRREFAARRFFFRPPDFLEASVRSSKPEDIFSAENISTSGFTLIESTRNTDTYRGRQIIDAAYGQAEVSIGESIALVSGFRLEESRQEVLTYSLHDAGLTPSRAALNDTSLLPASNLTLRLGPYVQLRGAYSKTVSRPDLRELSTGSYYDDRLNIEIEGFADLKKSDVQNIDARIELYSGDVHRFSLGVFRKDILRPIERVLLNVAGSDTKISYRNSKFARNEGIEFELATGVGPFVFSCNLALIRSAVTLDLDGIGNQTSLTSSKRPMQGVSPYILNLGLQYEPEGAPYRANLVFNEIGARITELGTNGVPDVFEQKKRTLDLVASFDVNESVSMGLKVSDIVPQGSTTTQDGKVILREPGSTTFSWTASATF
jgi:outer membrane receptor protein involved in Fe transport